MRFKPFVSKQWIKLSTRRRAKSALLAVLCVVISLGALGALLVSAATSDKDLRFDGKFDIKLMAKSAQGGFEVVDELRFDNGFKMKVSGTGKNSDVKFDLRWNGSSDKGRRVNLTVAGPGKATFDAATGLLRVSALYTGDVDGKPTSLQVDLTTEQITCTGSVISGKAVRMSGEAGEVELVSCSRVKDARVLASKKAADGGAASS